MEGDYNCRAGKEGMECRSKNLTHEALLECVCVKGGVLVALLPPAFSRSSFGAAATFFRSAKS